MKPKLIKTKADYEAALARIDEIFEAKPGTAAGDELELLVTLIELYEARVFPIALPTPLEAINFRMSQQGLKAKDLIPYLGSASKVSEVLSGRRELSKTMIRNLIQGLGIPAEVLLQEKPGGAELRGGAMSKPATFDVRRVWRQTEKALHAMTDAQRKQTLVDAGILTKGGQVARPYAGVIKTRSK